MKTVQYYSGSRNRTGNLLHIETDGCVVNIHVGLTDRQGRTVTNVEIIPDDESRGGDSEGRMWHVVDHGPRGVRIVREEEHHGEVFFDSVVFKHGVEYGNVNPTSGGEPIKWMITRAEFERDYADHQVTPDADDADPGREQ